MTFRLCCSVLLLAAWAGSAHAQLGTAFTYQGRLDDNGQPKTGTVDLRFDAYNVASSGAALNIAPVILDGVPLSNGVFTVTVDFGATVFLGDAIFLELGVREDAAGVAGNPAGFTVLAPRQPVSPAPYALHAANVAIDAIGGAQVLDGTLNASDVDTASTTVGLQRRLTNPCPAGQVINGIAANGTPACVSGGDITGIVTATGSGLNGGNGFGDITLSIDTNEAQARVTGKCQENDSVINRINANGSVTCLYIGTATPRTPLAFDSVGDVGSHLSARKEGFGSTIPAVAYYDATNQRLKFATCTHFTCSAGTVSPPVVLDDPVNNVGQNPSLVVIGSSISVAYYDVTAQDLKFAQCSDTTCTGPITTRILDSTGNVGRHISAMEVSSRFAAVYFDGNNNVYKYVRCTDPACVGAVPRTLTGLGGGGLIFSTTASPRDQNLSLPEFLVLKDGSDVVLVRCTDLDCAAFTTTVVSDNNDVGPPLAMLRASISGVLHRWFTYARPTSGNQSSRFCVGDACTTTTGITGNILPNPVFNGWVLREARSPLYLQTRSSTDTAIRTFAYDSVNETGTPNTLSASATAQGAFDAFNNYSGPSIFYYDTVAKDLMLLMCDRDDCSDQ